MPVELFKGLVTVLLAMVLSVPAFAQEQKEEPVQEGLVVGGNLKVGMSLEEAILLLGTPKEVIVKRGTEPLMDSIAIEYPEKGVVIFALGKRPRIEGVELLPSFRGSFAEGIQLKANFKDLINTYGKPGVLTKTDARYPDKGIFFFLKDDEVVSAKVFDRNTKLLDFQLLAR